LAREQAIKVDSCPKFRLGGYRALVVGCGSIGRRHARNLKSLGLRQLGFCDTSPRSAEAMPRGTPRGNFSDDYNEALRKFKPDIVLICTPPVYHVEEALAALQARSSHVFIEKPLSHESSGIQVLIAEARRRDRNVRSVTTCAFIPACRFERAYRFGKIGRVLWLNVEAGQYLPDWRPWQNYRESYSARHELGGGIILDGSHELDYICWLLGWPTEVTCRAEHLSSLDVGC
jgi:predicted dehydrogenase